jgi:hypothetical protein
MKASIPDGRADVGWDGHRTFGKQVLAIRRNAREQGTKGQTVEKTLSGDLIQCPLVPLVVLQFGILSVHPVWIANTKLRCGAFFTLTPTCYEE